MTVRDAQRSRVYQAEQLVARILDRSAEFPVVEVAGSHLTLPVERRFGTLESVQTYVDALLGLRWVRERWPRAVEPVLVRERRGQQQAHYDRTAAVIAVPLGSAAPDRAGPAWAMRELVVLHEVAHHLADDGCAPDAAHHGAEFVARYLELVDEIVGPEAAFLLRVTMLDVGVTVG